MHGTSRQTAAAFLIAVLSSITGFAQAAPPHIQADGGIAASDLSGWTTFGQADWTAQYGIVTGHPKTPGGGWLVFDQSMANVGFYTQILCAQDCEAGILLRAQKTPDGGLKGIYISMGAANRGIFVLTTDAEGREISRVAVPKGHSEGGLPSPNANTPPEIQALLKARSETYPSLRAMINYTGAMEPLREPTGEYLPQTWNSVNVYLFQDALYPSVNGARDGAGDIAGRGYAGGPGSVWKDRVACCRNGSGAVQEC